MKKRLLSLVLCLVMVFSLFPAFGMTAAAADANGITNPPEATDTTGDLHLTKNLAPGTDGAYDLTLQSWATGEVNAITEKIPTDFIVVADQSGSMSTTDMATNYTSASSAYLETIATSSKGYYYKDGDNYYRVYPVRGYLYKYFASNTLYPYDVLPQSAFEWFQDNKDVSFSAVNAYYYKKNGTYYQLHFDVYGRTLRYHVTPYFTDNSGTTTTLYAPDKPNYKNLIGALGDITPGTGWLGGDSVLYTGVNAFCKELSSTAFTYAQISSLNVTTGMYFDFPMYKRHVGYTKLCYRDINGVEHTISASNGSNTWEYCNSSGQAITTYNGSTRPSYTGLYTESGTNISRLNALKAALNQFATAVANETDSFGSVDNKISIVGFSSSGYNNTELLTGDHVTISNNNGVQKSTADNNESYYYGTALVDSTNGTVGTVNSKITAGINALTANGGTQPEDGLEMAYKVLTNRDSTTYTIRSGENKGQPIARNTIVIFFTDGQPGDYPFSNMYSEANDVVAAAKPIKDNGTKVFSIGVFGESDGNPLTYAAHRVSSENSDYEFELGWMETFDASGYSSSVTGGYRYQYLNRNWLPNDSTNYGANPNDTIYDYMSVVSSNYPSATKFMNVKSSNTAGEADTSGYSNYLAMVNAVRGTPRATNDYYRMASNQDTLVAAFLQAVTMNNTETTSISLNSDAVLKDVVNTDDFDVTNATVTAKVVNYSGTTDSTLTNALTTNTSNGTVTVSGFDYSAYHSESANPRKLVVTITGLTPKRATGTLCSNSGNASIYVEEDNPTAEIASPTLELSGSTEQTYVIDFSAPMTVARNVNKFGTKTNHNGDFDLNPSGDVTYKLHNINAAVGQTSDLKLSGVDTAMVYLNTSKWNKITTVPASSVYFDDDLTTAIPVGTGSGYNAAFAGNDAKYTENGTQNMEPGKYTFTFTGTGIDVYCTTDTESGYIQAKVDNTVKTVRNSVNSADHLRYNVPSVSFTCEPGTTHTLTLTVLGSSKYKLDGIRVYNAIGQAEYDNRGEEAAAEKNASYTNLHELLVNQKEEYTATATVTGGMLFVDDTSKLTKLVNATEYEIENGKDENNNLVKIVYVNENNEVVEAGTPGAKAMKAAYSTDYAAYKANSPKNEIYLAPGQGIAFTVKNYYTNLPEDAKVMVGLSTAQKGQTADITGIKDGRISSVVDMYYELSPERVLDSNENPTNDALFTIVNPDTNDCVVSVTNLKVSGGDSKVAFSIDGDKAITMSADDDQTAALDAESVELEVFVNEDTVRMASRMMLGAIHVTETPDDPQEPEVTPDPAPAPIETPAPVETPAPTQAPSVHDIVKQIVSSFVSNLFRSISRLFGN